jgi:hypothetical protein
MDKEFVTYEQAVVLNKLHYDGDYNYTYDIKKELWYGDIKADGKKYLAAPLKQQVFRWFREKYFLDCEIYLQEEIGHKFYHYLVLQLVRGNIEWKSKNTIKFKTYEEAENACIDKLIEIAKQQDNE